MSCRVMLRLMPQNLFGVVNELRNPSQGRFNLIIFTAILTVGPDRRRYCSLLLTADC